MKKSEIYGGIFILDFNPKHRSWAKVQRIIARLFGCYPARICTRETMCNWLGGVGFVNLRQVYLDEFRRICCTMAPKN